MADVIQLLPDAIANQIAAGEVIQRPASVVKELMENAIDAGSTSVKLIVKDAGKTLIQVIDDGCGMSETDARMAFERHATSKIRDAKDLFEIRTMGFRGEALASVAAVAQVEMRTRRQLEELGTRLLVEGSALKTQEPCQCAAGTTIAIKNLFYNVPARRNFLKSNSAEMNHIMNEFQRIAIAHPEVFFSLHHNNSEVFHLPPGKLRQRLVSIFGVNSNKKLVPLQEETDVLTINGYIGKPEFAKKTRGEQFFFVNNRFIKSGYLNHAVVSAYEDWLPQDTHPLYVIFLDMDPARIDINVHPTKQEIKFDDERLVYNYLKVAIRHALGQYNITPTLDFEQDMNFTSRQRHSADEKPGASNFQTKTAGSQGTSRSPAPRQERIEPRHQNNIREWEKLYEGLDAFDTEEEQPKQPEQQGEMEIMKSNWDSQELDDSSQSFSKQQKKPYQLHATYIFSQIKSGFMLIDQQAAHERILYERYLKVLQEQKASTQHALFPETIELPTADAATLRELIPPINQLGFDIQEFGGNSFVVNGVPADAFLAGKAKEMLETLLEQYRLNVELKLGTQENIARSMARSAAIKRGQSLKAEEMQSLIDQLFACAIPQKSPSGRKCFTMFELNELEKLFQA